MGFAGVYLIFLFLLQNRDCGYSLEPPRQLRITCVKAITTRTSESVMQYGDLMPRRRYVLLSAIIPGLSDILDPKYITSEPAKAKTTPWRISFSRIVNPTVSWSTSLQNLMTPTQRGCFWTKWKNSFAHFQRQFPFYLSVGRDIKF